MTFKIKIPSRDIRWIHDKMMYSDVEWGGFYIFKKSKIISKKKFKGEEQDVIVPVQDFYNIHWHTHPRQLIEDNVTSPFQLPSVDDISHGSFKYYTDLKLGRSNLIHLVFTQHGVYIHRPIPSILESFFKTKNYTIKTLNIENEIVIRDKAVAIWENKWYRPFEIRANEIISKLGTVFYNARFVKKTGYTDETFKEANAIEQEYFNLCREFGIDLVIITNWKELLNRGMTFTIH